MPGCQSELPLDFYQIRPLQVQFSGLDLSSDAGLLLVRQAEERLGICRKLAGCISEWRVPEKVVHPVLDLMSQRIYQLVSGYEDANDSNQLRHDPIYKIACDRLPEVGENALASQPTITRLENHVSREENAAMRRAFVEHFIAQYETAPNELWLDIDGWDAPTHGDQQLSLFHGYYG